MRGKKNTAVKIKKAVATFDGRAGDNGQILPPPVPRHGEDSLLTAVETADILRVPENTLAKWRCLGSGPRFIKVGANVRYRASDVTTYLDEQTRSSTSSEVSS
jgi:hypothetical protein